MTSTMGLDMTDPAPNYAAFCATPTAPRSPSTGVTQIDQVGLDRLIAAALLRLRRQIHFAAPLGAGGHKARQINDWLQTAADCVCALARPKVAHQALVVQLEADSVILPTGTRLDDARAVETLRRGGRLSLYLFSLGFDQRAAFDWLGGDYMAHHIQSELSRETLFALGRAARAKGLDGAPGDAKVRRIAVRIEAAPGAPRLWDVAEVQGLLSLVNGRPHGVTMSDSGCFQPLHSVLGLLLAPDCAAADDH